MSRVYILIAVNTDPVPGWGNQPEDYVKHLEVYLDSTIKHYDPKVTLLGSGADIQDRLNRQTVTKDEFRKEHLKAVDD